MSVAVEALCFDVFGTVVDWRSGVARELEAALAPKGIAADWGALASRWRDRYQPALAEVRDGRRPFVKLDVLHRENLVATLAETGIDALDDAALDELNLAWHRLDPWPDVLPGLDRLRRRFILAPLSNGNVRLMVDMARRAGLPWDAILGAEPAQAYKPMPEAYLRSIALLDLQPARCLMVAAHEDDLRAAAALGLRTAFVPRPFEHGANQPGAAAPSGTWDLVAGDFQELARQLGC